MKSYKVVPYVVNIPMPASTQVEAQRLEKQMNDLASQGWSFESIEKFETTLNTSGWWGVGATTTINSFQFIIFSKES